MNAPGVYLISRRSPKGLKPLSAILGRDEVLRRLRKPRDMDHLLLVNDFRIAVWLAAKAAGYEIPVWLDDLNLVQLSGDLGLLPDGYFQLGQWVKGVGKNSAYLLEVEKATKGFRQERKLARYRDWLGGPVSTASGSSWMEGA